MTVGIAARFEFGVVCASDSAISVGNNRITLPHVKGREVQEGFALYSGVLADAQKALRSAKDDSLLEVVLDMDWEENEGADFLVVTDDERLYTVDSSGARISHDDYGAIGHGSDLARFGLLMNYKPDKSEAYVKSMLKTIITAIERFDATVYGPVRFRVIYYDRP